MEKLLSASESEEELRGRTMGMGRVKKLPVLGSILTPIILPSLLESNRSGPAGLPKGGGGEKRSLRIVGGAAGALRMPATSKSEDRVRRIGESPTATTSSSSERSLLISTTLLGFAALRVFAGSMVLWRLRAMLEEVEALRDVDLAGRSEDPLGVPALPLRPTP